MKLMKLMKWNWWSESCQNWKLPKLKVAKIGICQNWKWFQYFLLKVIIFDELNWKLPKLKVAKIESCQNWKLSKLKVVKIESDFSISC